MKTPIVTSAVIENLVYEEESTDYGACRFTIAHRQIIFRVAKITPTKIGQFVTLWQRKGPKKPIQPFDLSTTFDFVVIAVRQNSHSGHFVFSKETLVKHDIISVNYKGGKRAFRLYPPWDVPNNNQARSSQAWQSAFFYGDGVDIGDLMP